jgi:hypothetical protein
MCVATNARCETVTIGLPQRIDASVASGLLDGAGRIAFAIIEAGSRRPFSLLRSRIRSFGTAPSFPIVANLSAQFETEVSVTGYETTPGSATGVR